MRVSNRVKGLMSGAYYVGGRAELEKNIEVHKPANLAHYNAMRCHLRLQKSNDSP